MARRVVAAASSTATRIPPNAVLQSSPFRTVYIPATVAGLVLVLVAVGVSFASERVERSRAFVLHRSIEAVVSEVEPKAGLILLRTDAGRLRLHAPPNGSVSLKRGEAVLLDVAMIRHPDPASLPHTTSKDHPLLMERLDGEVAGIQRSLGIVALRTPAGRLNVDLPLNTIEGLRTGDHVQVEVGVAEDTRVSASPRTDTPTQRRGVLGFLWEVIGRRR